MTTFLTLFLPLIIIALGLGFGALLIVDGERRLGLELKEKDRAINDSILEAFKK